MRLSTAPKPPAAAPYLVRPHALRQEQQPHHQGHGSPFLLRPHQYLLREGEVPSMVHLLIEGWACRYKLLPDGRRQISSLFIPGDYCDLRWLHGEPSGLPVVALTALRGQRIGCRELKQQAAHDADLQSRLWQESMRHSDIQAEWILNLGRKNATERLGHFFCEIYARLEMVGLAEGNRCPMPLTQLDLADITGLTPVHVNRTLQDMRANGLVELHSRVLKIPDLDRLKRVALFHGQYLRPPMPADVLT